MPCANQLCADLSCFLKDLNTSMHKDVANYSPFGECMPGTEKPVRLREGSIRSELKFSNGLSTDSTTLKASGSGSISGVSKIKH
jgi:hypothetical protein